jgi:membrane protein required for colicin V production
VLVVVLLAGLTPLPREPFWREAALSGPFETAALALRPYLPVGLMQRLKYR